ncbi:MAG: hypothetical protein PHI98_12415 [Eubacteriales bacterium]|nr:hypothetical protein [Eubacteriales bacterium]
MEGLFNPLSILLHVINAVILLVALYFLLYKPVRKFMAKRTDTVEKELKQAADAKADIDARQKKLKDDMLVAKKQADDAAAQIVAQAQLQARQIVLDAHADAELVMKQARLEADALRQNAKDDIQDEVATLCVNLAGKILQREVKAEDHSKLVNDFLSKVG